MKLLLDTHTAIWLMSEKEKLSSKAKAKLLNKENTLYVSHVSVWELAIKASIKKLPEFHGGVKAFLAKLEEMPIIFPAKKNCGKNCNANGDSSKNGESVDEPLLTHRRAYAHRSCANYGIMFSVLSPHYKGVRSCYVSAVIFCSFSRFARMPRGQTKHRRLNP